MKQKTQLYGLEWAPSALQLLLLAPVMGMVFLLSQFFIFRHLHVSFQLLLHTMEELPTNMCKTT